MNQYFPNHECYLKYKVVQENRFHVETRIEMTKQFHKKCDVIP